MIKSFDRIGNFTSSEIYRLLSKRKGVADEYINESNMERRLGRSLDQETTARPLSWGNLIEELAFERLGLDYKRSSTETIGHPDIKWWFGSPDGTNAKTDTVFDIKSPFTLKSFCQFADCSKIEDVRENHKDGEKYYWQLVSNCILTGCKYAELIVFCPYVSELQDIQDLCNNYDGGDQYRYKWIHDASPDELPLIPTMGFYKNLNIIRWEVSQEDKDLLTAAVIEAGKKLINLKTQHA
jgi:hypothetical protein